MAQLAPRARPDASSATTAYRAGEGAAREPGAPQPAADEPIAAGDRCAAPWGFKRQPGWFLQTEVGGHAAVRDRWAVASSLLRADVGVYRLEASHADRQGPFGSSARVFCVNAVQQLRCCLLTGE